MILSPERVAQLEAIDGWRWSDNRFEDGFDRLVDWLESTGSASPPASYKTLDGFALGKFVSRQRARFQQGLLTQERSDRLQALPGWVWDARHMQGRRSYVETKLRATLCSLFDGDQRLTFVRTPSGRLWCDVVLANQAVVVEYDGAYWHAGEDSIARDRRKTALLEAEGWTLVRVREEPLDLLRPVDLSVSPVAPFSGLLEAVVRRLGELGHAPTGQIPVDPDVAALTDDAQDGEWERMFGTLETFISVHGHASPESGHIEGEDRLGQWVGVQRRTFRRERLRPDRKARLEALPGWSWGHRSVARDLMIAALLGYTANQGHTEVPRSFVTDDGLALGLWVYSQRQRNRLYGGVSTSWAAALEAVPFWTWEQEVRPWVRRSV